MNNSTVCCPLRGDMSRILGSLGMALFALVFCFAASPSPARAHPHAWIDLRSTVVLDSSGRVTAIELQWLLDQFYTAFITEELSDGTDIQAEALAELTRGILRNLRAYDYFTEVHAGDTKIALDTVNRFESELREGRLWIRFLVPLATPVDPNERVLAFAVFDPTYYIEILHLQDDVVAFRGVEPGGCYGHIVPPNPTVEAVILAQAMDRDATPDATLGSVFAERVEVTCR